MKISHNICILLASFVFWTCQSKKDTSNSETTKTENTLILNQKQIQNTKISIGKLEKSTVGAQLALNSTIEVPPQNLVSVGFPLGGYLKTTHLLPGTHVRKGEIIAQIENQQFIDLQKMYLVAKSQIQYLKKEAERQQELSANLASSQKEAQMAVMNLQIKTVNLNAISEKLKMIGVNPDQLSSEKISKTVVLRSPIDGFVTKVNTLIGKYFNPSEELFQLVNPEDIHLNLKVFQQDLDKIKLDQTVRCYLPSTPNEVYTAEIILISKNVNENQTVDVHCHFQDFGKKLVPGMFMNAFVELNSNRSWTAPEDAIVQFENQNYLFSAKDKNTFELIPVQIGTTEHHRVVVSSIDSTANYVLNDAYTLLLELKKSEEE